MSEAGDFNHGTPDQIYNAGVAQFSNGQHAAALATAEALIREGLSDAAVFNLAATAAYTLGDTGKAERHWRAAVTAQPSFAEAHNNLGVLLQAQGRLSEAESAYREALRLRPANPGALHNLGRVQADLGQHEAAERSYRAAIALHPQFPAALLSLGQLHESRRNYQSALEAYTQGVALAPDLADAHNNLGRVLQELGRFGEAEGSYRKAAALRPGEIGFHYNLATALSLQFRFAEAEDIYRHVVARKPDYPEAYQNLGILLRNTNRLGESEQAFRKALALRPDYADAKWNLAMLVLSQGRFAEGWPLFEARLEKGFKDEYHPPALPFPPWRGEDLTGKSLLVIREQGLGDELQCIRFADLLKKRGAGHITWVTHPALLPLFKNVRSVDAFVTTEDNPEIGPHDYWAFPYNMPRFLCPTEAEIPARLPYITVDQERARAWRAKLPAKGLKVGLVWRGNVTHRNDANRSIHVFSHLKPLWSVPGITFISLQKGADEALTPPSDQPMRVLGPQIRDYADTAAIASQLDLVICVDTSVAHMAGALGKPCWVLVPQIDTDWRWLRGRADTPWYPNAVRVFWQRGHDSWEATIAEVAVALRAHAGA